MLEYDEIRLEMEGLHPQLKELEEAMNMDKLKKEAAELEEQSARPDFWNDAENSQKIMQKIGALKNKISSFNKLKESFEDVITMIELADDEEDASMLPEIKELAAAAKSHCFRANTTVKMQFSPSMRGRAEPKLRIGWKCFTECTTDGRSAIISRWSCLTIWTEKSRKCRI